MRPPCPMAQRTGTGPSLIFPRWGRSIAFVLQKADPVAHVSDIRFRLRPMIHPSAAPERKQHPDLGECQSILPGDPSEFLQRSGTLSEDFRCFPIVGDVSLLAAMVKEDSGIWPHRSQGLRGRWIRERGDDLVPLFGGQGNVARLCEAYGRPHLGRRLTPKQPRPSCPPEPPVSSSRASTG